MLIIDFTAVLFPPWAPSQEKQECVYMYAVAAHFKQCSRPSFHPLLLLCVLFYTGVTSQPLLNWNYTDNWLYSTLGESVMCLAILVSFSKRLFLILGVQYYINGKCSGDRIQLYDMVVLLG